MFPSIIGRLKGMAAPVGGRAKNEQEGIVQDAPPPASSNNGARSSNAPPRSKAVGHRAIGKPTSCCSTDVAKGCLFSTNGKPASTWFTNHSIEKRSEPLGPSAVNSANFPKP